MRTEHAKGCLPCSTSDRIKFDYIAFTKSSNVRFNDEEDYHTENTPSLSSVPWFLLDSDTDWTPNDVEPLTEKAISVHPMHHYPAAEPYPSTPPSTPATETPRVSLFPNVNSFSGPWGPGSDWWTNFALFREWLRVSGPWVGLSTLWQQNLINDGIASFAALRALVYERDDNHCCALGRIKNRLPNDYPMEVLRMIELLWCRAM